MKTLYKTLPAIASQNITLLLGEDTGMNIDASIAHAIELASSQESGNVLYLNTVQTARYMYESARSHGLDPNRSGFCTFDPTNGRFIRMMNVRRGELHKSRAEIENILSEGRIQYVIVNSWEFAAKSSRYREEAVFFLKELISGMEEEYDAVSVLVYGEELKKKTKAEKIDRGGYGKLAALAKKVESITIISEFQTMADILAGGEETSIVNRRSSVVEMQEKTAQVVPPTKDDRRPAKDDSVTSIEELRTPERPIPERLSQMPIHLNGYSPDKSPAPNTIRPYPHTPAHCAQ